MSIFSDFETLLLFLMLLFVRVVYRSSNSNNPEPITVDSTPSEVNSLTKLRSLLPTVTTHELVLSGVIDALMVYLTQLPPLVFKLPAERTTFTQHLVHFWPFSQFLCVFDFVCPSSCFFQWLIWATPTAGSWRRVISNNDNGIFSACSRDFLGTLLRKASSLRRRLTPNRRLRFLLF